MHTSRTQFRALLVLVAVAVIGVFGFLFRNRLAPGGEPKPAIIEVVNRGLKPEDEQQFRDKLAGLLAEKATLTAEGKTDITLLLRIGVQYYILGEVGNAAQAYREILAINPNDAAAFENLGQALYEMGDYVGSLEAWQRAATLSPSETTYFRIVELINTQLPEHKARIPALMEHGIANIGQTYGFMIRLGDWYAEQGDYVRAVSHYEVALQLSENAESRTVLEGYRQKMRDAEAQQLQGN
jgi:tetratricopeptide (TPR) repeat protein